MVTMKNLTVENIPSEIAHIVSRGARPITITVLTTPKNLSKAGRVKFGNVRKASLINGMLNTDYEASVNRQLTREDKEAEFAVEQNWFTHTDTPAIVAHRNDNTKLYLQVKVEKAIEANYFDGAGELIPYATIHPFLYAKNAGTKQGTDKPVLSMTVAVENIVEFVCDKETYRICKNKYE